MSKNDKNRSKHAFQALNSASTQGLNDAIKTRKRGRVFFRVIMVILALAAIGGGIAIYFILNRKTESEGVEVAVTVWMKESITGNYTYRNYYEFKAEDSSMTYGSEDNMEANIDKGGKVEIIYGITNSSGRTYNYQLSFDHLEKDGFYIDYYVEYESDAKPIPEDGIISLQKGGNFAVVVRITLAEYSYNHECSGYISMNISIV